MTPVMSGHLRVFDLVRKSMGTGDQGRLGVVPRRTIRHRADGEENLLITGAISTSPGGDSMRTGGTAHVRPAQRAGQSKVEPLSEG